jgi:hypothetical protein
MNILEKSAHPERSLKPLVWALGIALTSAVVAAPMDSGIDKNSSDCVQIRADGAGSSAGMQAEKLAYQVGSGYTGDEDSRAIPADRLNDDLAVQEDAVQEDLTAGQFDRGYYQEPGEIAVVVPAHDGTAYQFNRGYYQDPDAVIVVINSASAADET